MDPKFLKLTPMDDEIYTKFREDFKNLDVKLISEDELKNKENKEVRCTACFQNNHCQQAIIWWGGNNVQVRSLLGNPAKSSHASLSYVLL